MAIEAFGEIQPVFDPEYPGRSMDALSAMIPQRATTLAGMQLGETLSRRVGHGLEIDGIRAYQPGDERRAVDMRATGRQADGTLMVRQHYEEITPTLWLVTDSLQHRHRSNAGHFSERDLAASAAISLLQIADRQGMPSAIVTVNDQGIWQTEPNRGRAHAGQVRNKLAGIMLAESPTDTDITEEKPLSAGLVRVAKRVTESVVVVVSDFRSSFDPEDKRTGWKRPLQQLRQNGNDVIAVELTNPWDFILPEESDRFTLGKSGVFIGGKKRQQFRDTYSQLAQQQQETIDRAIGTSGATHIKLSTAQGRWFSSLRDQLTKQNHKNR